MDIGTALLKTGKFALKATVAIAEVAVEVMADKVSSAYSENKIDKDKYSNFAEKSKSVSDNLSHVSNLLDKK